MLQLCSNTEGCVLYDLVLCNDTIFYERLGPSRVWSSRQRRYEACNEQMLKLQGNGAGKQSHY